MNINSQSLQAFLADRGAGSENRLYVKNKELHYSHDVGCMSRFAAKLGFGSASMSNVAKFIRKNQDVCFANVNDIPTYNNFIVSYNDKQSICWKKARQIKRLVLLKPVLKGDVQQAIKTHLENGQFLLQSQGHRHLIQTCQKLKKIVEKQMPDGKLSKDEKKTLNEILAFKNQVRNSSFPPKTKARKGPKMPLNPPVDDKVKEALRATLREMSTQVLRKRFGNRLASDQDQLNALKSRFKTHNFSERQFLQNQINRWQKKLDQGKPIAIPKWYHCTKEANTVRAILDTDIIYMHKSSFGGAFVSNKPEMGSYGEYCFMLSERIEKTGTKKPGTKAPLYPKQSSFYGDIHYSNTRQVPFFNDFTDLQTGTQVWLSFQIGKQTLNHTTKMGTAGIPIRRNERIQKGDLDYYKDTSVGFIYNTYNDAALAQIGREKRIQVITNWQADALRSLVNATFYCTLPANWQDKIHFCSF